jgi:hypothetical protein
VKTPSAMTLVDARAPPAHRQSPVCRLSPSGPACRTPGGGSPAFRSSRSLMSWLEDAGLLVGRRGPTDAGGPRCSHALGFAARPEPAHEVQIVAPGEAVRKPAPDAADCRRPRRRRWCLCSKPCQCPTHRDEQVTNIDTISGTGRSSPERASFAIPERQIRPSIRLDLLLCNPPRTASPTPRLAQPSPPSLPTTNGPPSPGGTSEHGVPLIASTTKALPRSPADSGDLRPLSGSAEQFTAWSGFWSLDWPGSAGVTKLTGGRRNGSK